jgi:predicted metalloprotease with PDZ domain
MIKSADILKDLEDILYAASDFTDGLPVDRYVFLFHFEDLDFGAWEHSYSSGYVLRESPLDAQKINGIRSIVAHEFFHVVTPLNIHSELVGQFNFETPVFSQHLWLYEGVTEWAAWKMQLQDSIISLDTYLNRLTLKLKQNDGFDPTTSLTELGVKAMDLPTQYENIYSKGAMTASILDLILLEQSKGKRSLRIVINELAKEYGPTRPFSEEGFFDELTASTYPEVGEFINQSIKGTEPLPIKEHFESIGIDYTAFAGYDSSRISLEFGFTLKDNRIVIPNVENSSIGIQSGDILHKIDGAEISLMNARQELGKMNQKKPGDIVAFAFIRDGEEVEVNYTLPAFKISHQFKVLEKPSKKQLKLREKWLTN